MAGMGKAESDRAWYMIDEIDLMPLIVQHSHWRRACDRLEAIADALPTMPTTIEWAALRCQLRTNFAEPKATDPLPLQAMLAREAALPQIRGLLDRLRDRRIGGAVDAQDLADVIAGDPWRVSADTLGYMLRAVFAGFRETIALETFALLLAAPHRLTAQARALLLQNVAEMGRSD